MRAWRPRTLGPGSYSAPLLAHATLEPQNATVLFEPDAPGGARAEQTGRHHLLLTSADRDQRSAQAAISRSTSCGS